MYSSLFKAFFQLSGNVHEICKFTLNAAFVSLPIAMPLSGQKILSRKV